MIVRLLQECEALNVHPVGGYVYKETEVIGENISRRLCDTG